MHMWKLIALLSIWPIGLQDLNEVMNCTPLWVRIFVLYFQHIWLSLLFVHPCLQESLITDEGSVVLSNHCSNVSHLASVSQETWSTLPLFIIQSHDCQWLSVITSSECAMHILPDVLLSNFTPRCSVTMHAFCVYVMLYMQNYAMLYCTHQQCYSTLQGTQSCHHNML